MKWSKARQLVSYIFAHCITLVPSLPSTSCFAIQSPLAKLLYWLPIKQKNVLGNTAALGISWKPYMSIWVAGAKSSGCSYYPSVLLLACSQLDDVWAIWLLSCLTVSGKRAIVQWWNAHFYGDLDIESTWDFFALYVNMV